MPRMTPLLSSMTCMVRSRSMLLGEKMSGVVASPVRQMCRKGMISVALPGMMWAGKTAVGIASAAAGIHHGGYASAHAADIGVDTVAVHAFVNVGVEVDEAGGDVFAFYFDNARCLVSSDIGGDGGDFAVFDGYVERAVQPLRGVDNSAALDEQVIHERYASVLVYAEWVRQC